MARKKPISVNVRVIATRPITEAQARRALSMFIDGEDPEAEVFVDGIRVRIRGVDWQTKGKRVVRGEPDDLEGFRAILYTEGVDALRAGAVKRNRL